MTQIINFLTETWHRIFGTSPSYFAVVQKISVIVAALSGLPLLLQQLHTETGFNVPAFMTNFANKAFLIGSVVAFVIARLPVSNPNAIKIDRFGDVTKKLPFTNN